MAADRMPAALHALRCAAQLFGDDVAEVTPLYVRYNRATQGSLTEGDALPRLTLHHPTDGRPVPLVEALSGAVDCDNAKANPQPATSAVPTLLVSGSWT